MIIASSLSSINISHVILLIHFCLFIEHASCFLRCSLWLWTCKKYSMELFLSLSTSFCTFFRTSWNFWWAKIRLRDETFSKTWDKKSSNMSLFLFFEKHTYTKKLLKSENHIESVSDLNWASKEMMMRRKKGKKKNLISARRTKLWCAIFLFGVLIRPIWCCRCWDDDDFWEMSTAINFNFLTSDLSLDYYFIL